MSLERLPIKIDDPDRLRQSGLGLVHRVLEPRSGSGSGSGRGSKSGSVSESGSGLLAGPKADLKPTLESRLNGKQAVRPRPTVVMLHGMGGDERVMWIFASRLPKDWLIVAPRAIHPAPGMDGFAWQPRGHDEWPDLDAFGPAADAVADFVEALPAAYNADPERIYLMGFSQGAATAISLAMTRPGLIAGIASLVGFAPEAPTKLVDARPLDGLPVFIAKGKADPLVPIDIARASTTLVEMAGADVEAFEYDAGHKINGRGMRDLVAWFENRV